GFTYCERPLELEGSHGRGYGLQPGATTFLVSGLNQMLRHRQWARGHRSSMPQIGAVGGSCGRGLAQNAGAPRLCSRLSQRVAAFEELAWSLLPNGYRPLELPPVCPHGTNSLVATVNQNKVISTIRNTEVVADSTNVLALECALRRRSLLRDPDARSEPVCLA